MDEREYVVAPADAGQRLDRYLAGAMPEWSRTQAQDAIAAGRVTLNGRATKPGQSLIAGDIVRAPGSIARPVATTLAAEAIPLRVAFEDADLLVVEKPAGMVVHPAPGHAGGTLVNALLAHTAGDLAGDDDTRPGIVHRLDRDTSGLLIVAKSAAALAGLSQQMRDRTITKAYIALVEGALTPPAGIIDAPIGRDPRHRQRMAILTNGGRSAQTRFATERVLRGRSLLTVHLITGRTHQIRVHMAAVGHPVVGDPVYGRPQEPMPPRLFLHAARVSFTHPVTGAPVDVTAPLPADLATFLDALAGGTFAPATTSSLPDAGE